MEKNRGHLFIISGPSGVGKSKVWEGALKSYPSIWYSVSDTTRGMRDFEKNGVEYYFISEEEFSKRINDGYYLEHDFHNESYYGTPKQALEDHLNKGIDTLLEIEIKGTAQIMSIYPDATFIFILPPSMEILKKRLDDRASETPEQKEERFRRAEWEMSFADKYDYTIVNDDLEIAVKRLEIIIGDVLNKVNDNDIRKQLVDRKRIGE